MPSFHPQPGALKEDVASAGAAYLLNVLPDLMKLPASELFEALKLHLLAFLSAYDRERRRKAIKASAN